MSTWASGVEVVELLSSVLQARVFRIWSLRLLGETFSAALREIQGFRVPPGILRISGTSAAATPQQRQPIVMRGSVVFTEHRGHQLCQCCGNTPQTQHHAS